MRTVWSQRASTLYNMAMDNLQGKASLLAFIDFDGVFCDSLTECFVSSWIAYHQLYRKSSPVCIQLDSRSLYDTYRPLIRRGGDYVILQHCVYENIPLNDQSDFDAVEASLGELADEFHTLFYDARKDLLKEDKDFWNSLNHVFSDFLVPAKAWAKNPACYVLSTKEAPFLREILLANGIDWPLERLICSGKRPKIEFIKEVLEATDQKSAMLFEDQVDHLYRLNDSRVRGYLASWGYVKPEWLTQKDFPVICQAEMISLIADAKFI